MSSVSDPNWLAIASVFFILIGLGIVARAFLPAAMGLSEAEKISKADSHRAVNLGLGVPVLGIGFLLNAMSHMGSVSLTPFMIGVMLALAFGLLLYGSLEHWLADAYAGDVTAQQVKPAKLAVVSVVQPEAVETIETRRAEAASQS